MRIEKHNGIYVLRDDLLPGGTKSVFLSKILDTTKDYFVYASPVYGGMQIALAHYCKSINKQAVIFSAKRREPHPNSIKAKEAGAIVYQVPYGYLNVTTKHAREFAEKNNAQLIAFGADYPVAVDAIANRMRMVTATLGFEPQQIFCAVGSGTLLKGIIKGTDEAKVVGIRVGADLDFVIPGRVSIIKYHRPFEQESRYKSDFASCPNYDLKAWEYCNSLRSGTRVFFWNVL